MLPIYKWGCMRSCPRSYKEFSFPSLGGVAQKNNLPFPWTAWSWAKGNTNHTGSVSDRSYGGMSPSNTTSKSKICSCRSFIAIDYFYRAPPLQLQEPLDLSKYCCTSVNNDSCYPWTTAQKQCSASVTTGHSLYSEELSLHNKCAKSCLLPPVTFVI